MQEPTGCGEAMGRKYPEQVAIAIAKDAEGKFNPITLGWCMNTSGDPAMLAISVGLERHSLGAIRHARQFVVSFPSVQMADEALFFGTHSGRDMDKLAACGTPTQPATRIDGVLLADAVANFECELETELPTGDHVIFVGRIVAAHAHQDASVARLYSRGGELGLGGAVPA
ncbi:MAG: flavin reductase [Planctomycetaceae bacterium]|nr:flavin reductase [Planctomycetaceae bacterium]